MYSVVLALFVFLFTPRAVFAASHISRLQIPLHKSTVIIEKKDGTNTKKILVSDYLTSTKVIISEKGTVASAPSYYPYGSSISPITLAETNKQYTGQQKVSDESSVYNYNARYYNPSNGIFIQPDTVEGPTRFTYVAGNPVMHNDPSGHCTICVDFDQNRESSYGRGDISHDFGRSTRTMNGPQPNLVATSHSRRSFELLRSLSTGNLLDKPTVLETYFPKGSFGTFKTGALWTSRFEPSTMATLSFGAKFSEDFDFSRGGKLHGLCNGPCPMGGAKTGENGMSARFMYLTRGQLAVYLYHSEKDSTRKYGRFLPLMKDAPEMSFDENENLTDLSTNIKYNPGFINGYEDQSGSIGPYEVLTARPGQWQDYQLRVQLNDGGRNGQIQAWVNGKKALDVRGFNFIHDNNDRYMLQNSLFQTFAGGNDNTWAPKNDSSIQFDYFNVSRE